mgnify:CR=1 FL=1
MNKRRELPSTRESITHRFQIGEHVGYLTVGLYEDGSPGELFLIMSKEGSSVSGWADAFSTVFSYALQYGVPLEDLVAKLSFSQFEPSGWTKHENIHFAKSVVDYVVRWLEWRFLKKTPQPEEPLPPPPPVASPASISEELPRNRKPEELPVWLTPSEGVPFYRPASAGTGACGCCGKLLRGSEVNNCETCDRELHRIGVEEAAKAGNDFNGEAYGYGPKPSEGTNKRGAFQNSTDAPPCPTCGSQTVRNGSCYLCHVCGGTSGCS